MKTIPICGYPRSGNTSLSYAIQMLYYPSQTPNPPRHTTQTIKNNPISIVPFRNPLDSIASWAWFYTWQSTLEEDVKFYIRFYSVVLDNLNKVVLMDFEYFTKDLNYINNKIYSKFEVTTEKQINIGQIKKGMLADNKAINLPRDNKAELASIKADLQRIPEFQTCLDLYAQLKAAS